ncbi:hypothetical protein IPM62_03985 [Candidatus Woesebacteria bacterium]|nr:MAG: hypothetical protein IPM62_03985 [Candidatus Woesebacteria bacterium]
MPNTRFAKNTKIDTYTFSLFELAKKISKTAENYTKEYFIGGGLAIDLYVGKVTRNHHDIDFHPMLDDYEWWKSWFVENGYKIDEPASDSYPETCKVLDKDCQEIVDMWPFKLTNGVLEINKEGKYVDAHRKWYENETVEFEGIKIRIENPLRVLDQKKRHFKEGQDLRIQDKHDFEVLGKYY